MSTLSARYSPVVLTQNNSPVHVFNSPVHPYNLEADDKTVPLLSESHHATPRSLNISERTHGFDGSSNNSHEVSFLSLTSAARFDYQWGIRHNVSYWNAINFIFGSLCFTIGAISTTLELSPQDHYVLTDVLYFAGGIGFAIGCYLGYYEVINEQHDGPDKVRRRPIFFYRSTVKKTINFWMALLFVVGAVLYQVSLAVFISGIELPWYSASWYLLVEIPLFIGGSCFFIGGVMEMYVNKAWQWQHRSLGWCVSWCNGFGGLFFFVAGVGSYFQSKKVELWCVGLSWSIGSFTYLVGSVLALFMWKQQKFGLVYLPEMNVIVNLHDDDDSSRTRPINDHDDGNDEDEDEDEDINNSAMMLKKMKRKTRRKVDIVLYRDIAFICLYVVTLTIGVAGVSYSISCQLYVDWIKNFILAILASIVILAMGSFIHREPERPPFSYLLWFLRFFMAVYTINLGIDTYHLTGGQCQLYGAVPLHPFPH